MVEIRHHDKYFSFLGVGVTIAFMVWLVIGFSQAWPFWLIFAIPVPILIVCYILILYIRFRQNPDVLDTTKDLETKYADVKL